MVDEAAIPKITSIQAARDDHLNQFSESTITPA